LTGRAWLRCHRTARRTCRAARRPAAQVRHIAGVGAAQPKRRLLQRVVRLVQRAEQPVRDRAQVRAVFVKPFGQPVLLSHRHLPIDTVTTMTEQTRPT
jgi:hypothetical protein